MLSVDFTQMLGTFRLEAKFDARESSITAIFGRSGAGKTSLINTISGLAMPDSGLIRIGDTTLFDKSARINVPTHKRRIGYVFQDDRLFPHMTVRNNLMYGAKRARSDVDMFGISEVVDLLDITSLLNRKPKALSGGEKQRVAIGRALLSRPHLLLMDEPLASLDFQRRHEILPFIERVREEIGITVIYVTHSIEEVIYLADQIIVLSEGKVAAQGSVEEIMSRLDMHPMIGHFDAGSVISANYLKYDQHFDLGELSFPGGTLRVSGFQALPGTALRAHIRARDVSLMLSRPENTSVLNVFRGRIIEACEEDAPQLDLLIDIGSPLVARVTRKSYHDLGLKIGTEVYAMIKAVAIDRRNLGTTQWNVQGS